MDKKQYSTVDIEKIISENKCLKDKVGRFPFNDCGGYGCTTTVIICALFFLTGWGARSCSDDISLIPSKKKTVVAPADRQSWLNRPLSHGRMCDFITAYRKMYSK